MRVSMEMTRVVAVGALVVVCCGVERAEAVLTSGKTVSVLRTSMGSGEGYLNFVGGAEYTGYTDDQETSRDGGRDIADNWFTVKNIVVESNNGAAPADAGTAAIANDYDFALKIYAQAGLAIRAEAPGEAQANSSPPYTDDEIFRDGNAIITLSRSENSDTINHYYITDYKDSIREGGALAPKTGSPTPAATVRDNRSLTTVAHELGHMLFNGPVIHSEDPNEVVHSTDITNLMFFDTSNAAQQLTDVGPVIGSIGGHEILTRDQIKAIHGNPGANNPEYVKHSNNSSIHGDRADFDWVSDHLIIQSIAGVSNGADINDGADFLVWEINAEEVMEDHHEPPDPEPCPPGPGSGPFPCPGPGPLVDHPHKAPDLDRSGYEGDSFSHVDVISNINRYADNDTTSGASPTDKEIRKAKALDYKTPEFSEDGSVWVPGQLVQVFEPGWTNGALQDDYVARWRTGIEAKYVRISALGVNSQGHDGNTQIDAVIAAAVAKPPTFGPVAGTLSDSSISGPSPVDSITVDTALNGYDVFNPEAKFFDPNINQEVTLPLSILASFGDDPGIVTLDVSFSPNGDVALLPSPGTSLDLLLNLNLGDGVTSLLPMPFADDSGGFFDTSLGPDGSFADTQFMVESDDGTIQVFNLSLEMVGGFAADIFEPSLGPPDMDVELSLSFEELLLNSGGLTGGSLVDVPLFSLTISTAQELIPEPGSGVLALGLLGLVGAGRPRRL